jgi:predicted RNase H-like nuclease (RuvC/YqgF family)
MMLSQSEQNLNPLLDEPPNSNSESGELLNMLNSQMQNLLTLETQWQALETHYKTLSTYNRELLNLLDESKRTIAQLRWNLECALERVQDAEEGAIALLDENAAIFQQARLAVANIANLQRELEKSKRSVIIGFTAGGVSFGVGTPLIVEGVRSDNRTMTWAGVGVTVGTGAI